MGSRAAGPRRPRCGRLAAILLCSLGLAPVCAETLDIAGTPVSLPPPAGFIAVTEEMGELYRWVFEVTAAAIRTHETLAFYVPQSTAWMYADGRFVPLTRWCDAKIAREAKAWSLSRADFVQVREQEKAAHQATRAALREQLEPMVGQLNEAARERLPAPAALRVPLSESLPPHRETPDALAVSMVVTVEADAHGARQTVRSPSTTWTANVAGKVLHLSCYGPEGHLAWTREATRDWAGVVLSRNPGPPAETVRAGSGSDLGWWGTGALLAGFAGGIAVYWWRRLSGGPLSRG
jgi:hypothetical protein